MGLKTKESNSTRITMDLLNQSPELYESRSSDFERSISSPEWKNGIPCTQKFLGYSFRGKKTKIDVSIKKKWLKREK